MIRIAIVGNIASGKSTVEKILENLGYKVLDTDKVCHNLLESEEVVSTFKIYDVFDDGKISRSKLGNLVFSNDELKTALENLMYPMVRKKIEDFFKQNNTEDFVFVSAPQLFEARMENLFDKILFIYCDDTIREQRLVLRNNYTKEYAKLRMSKQMGQDEKADKSDWVIYNNASVEDLKERVISLIEQIR